MSGGAMVTLGAAAWRFGSPGALLLLLALPLVVGFLWFAFARRRRGLAVFAGATPQETRPSTMRAGLKLALTTMGLASLIVALARPQADPVEENVTVRGRDVVFIVDVSKSMLSRDAVPNRLSRAKLWINDLVNTLRGDRVGLVAFAGAAVVKSPLTMDYGFFRMALDELSPASVPRGGTLIGDAIRKAMADVFEQGPGRYRDIVLITDGEDQGSFPTEAAKQAAEQGVRLIVIGIGSEVEGAPVPSEEKSDPKYVEFHGERVRSRLDQTTLAAIAEAASRAAGDSGGGGVFLNVGTGTIDLDRVYHDLVGTADQRETEAKSNVLYRELFPYFLLLAGACLALEPVIGGRIRIRRAANVPAKIVGARAAVAGIVLASLLMPAPVRAAPAGAPANPDSKSPTPPSGQEAPALPADARYNSGRELFLAGKYKEAAEQFRDADIASRDPELSARARFNLGQALLKQPASQESGAGKETPEQVKARLEGAARAFRSALEADPNDAEAARNVEIARRMLHDFEEQQEKERQQQQKNQQSKDGDSKDQKQDDQPGDKQDQGDGSQKDKDQKDQQGQQSGKAGAQNQQNADKLKELADQQERAADQSKKASDEKNAGEMKKEQDQAKRDQQAVNEKTEQQQKESEQSAGKEAKEKTDAAQKEQKAASEALEKGDAKTAEDHQRKAAELLKEAAKAEQDKADQAKQEEAKQAEAKQTEAKNQDKNAKQKEEQPKYDQTASQLLDKERKERDARQQMLRALRGRPVPVEKDW
ncbi:MAG: VWA domain-containing protein [Phycisphaerales bacterium]|nr:VWA domain-containing protein [Phycisphaerales bacterium]